MNNTPPQGEPGGRGAAVRRRHERKPAGRARVTRQSWVETALDELGRHGPDEVNIDRLAIGLDRTKGSFYNHFDDRDDLILAIGEAILDADAARRPTYQTSDPDEAVRLLHRLFDFAYSASDEQHAFFHLTRLTQPAELGEIIARIRRHRIATYQELLVTAGVDPTDADHWAVLMHNAFVGHHSLIETNPEHRAVPEYIVAVKALLIPALATG